ncbi:CidA/LrgA family protein [Pseudoroseomonas cervicalis]|uniref:LrgA family protein n=1 Tax=Pseudoroseomonas cervicalis ATCC 49957 TaxID=525371 RepID=D5RSA7_9PROT|nr:CidA/LrgA family protein [Pseudoroseomonas cervicalis]EFH09810.1 LrgA family protein [Pseudoroseomonas cervicalis ATCC 49957]
MIRGLALLLLCQLCGEVAARALHLPVPGPVLGMVLLFAGLLLRDRLRDDGAEPEAPGTPGLGQTADTLLTHLGLLFVPAGVGVVVYLPVLARDWAPLSLAVLVGTLAGIGFTGWLAERLMRRHG